MKLLIGVPTGGQPTRPFLDALAQLTLPDAVSDAERVVWAGNFVSVQREMIARDALERDADLLAMIDDDVVAPPDALVKLLAALDADPAAALAGALYHSRDGSRPMVVDRWTSADTTSAAIPPYTQGSVASVDGVGFGCVLVRVAVLRALEPPYFTTHAYVDPATRTVRQCDEDYLFCERVRRSGRHVLLHAGVRALHYDRASDTTAPANWEADSETDRLRMFVRRAGGTALVPFDDTVPRAPERQEAFPATLVFSG
ncbi:MAG: glycosyltransferase [Candidatus Elarobacter sp.]